MRICANDPSRDDNQGAGRALLHLARDPDLHARSVAQTGERVVSRTGTGLLGLGDVVTFEARHFGVRQQLAAKIIRFEPPHLFEDQMVRGAFKSFRHVHAFEQTEAGTRMIDTFEYEPPLGPLGRWQAASSSPGTCGVS